MTANTRRHPVRRHVPLLVLVALIVAVTWIHSDRRATTHVTFKLAGTASTAGVTNASSVNEVAIPSDGRPSTDGTPPAVLYPGVRVNLVLSVHNSRVADITINDLNVTVGDATPGCRSDNITVEPPA